MPRHTGVLSKGREVLGEGREGHPDRGGKEEVESYFEAPECGIETRSHPAPS